MPRTLLTLLLVPLLGAATGCSGGEPPGGGGGGEAARPVATTGGDTMAFSLTSSTFQADGPIPRRCTCEGDDVSPALAWSGAPDGTRSFALIVDDPDAPDPANPKTTWVHWVAYDIPPSASSLPEGAADGGMPDGAREGLNDWKRTGFGGPCPPIGRHRYVHKLYALDVELGGRGPLTKAELEQAMTGHVLAQARLIGTYQKHGS